MGKKLVKLVLKRAGITATDRAIEALEDRTNEENRQLLRQVDILCGCVVAAMVLVALVSAISMISSQSLSGVGFLIGGIASVFMALWARRMFRWLLRLEQAGKMAGEINELCRNLWQSRHTI